MWKLKGLCMRHMLKTSLFEMSPKNWVNTTLCHFYKRNWYIMLMSCWWDKLMNVKTLFANHFKCSFLSNKSMSCMKTLFDFIPQSVDHNKTSDFTKVLLNCVCNIPNFVIQLLWSYNFCIFLSVENDFLRFNWLRSIDRYWNSCYMHSFLKNHKKLNLGFWFLKSIDKNNKSQQGTWNGSLARRSRCK